MKRFKKADLDYTNLVVEYDQGLDFHFEFPVRPGDYLMYARDDLKENSERGLINAISNAKRCIDCLVETILNCLNIDLKKIPKSAKDFCNDVLPKKEHNIDPFSIRLFCALRLAPSLLISEVRNLRHKVEHDYEIPKEIDVERAIDVAELLIHNIKGKEIGPCLFDLKDINKFRDSPKGHLSGICFGEAGSIEGKMNFSLRYYNRTNTTYFYNFVGDESMYFYFLRLMFIDSVDGELVDETMKKMLSKLSLLQK